MEEADGQEVDLDRLMETDSGEDKIFAAMGVAKTITTVSKSEVFWRINHLTYCRWSLPWMLRLRYSHRFRRL